MTFSLPDDHFEISAEFLVILSATSSLSVGLGRGLPQTVKD